MSGALMVVLLFGVALAALIIYLFIRFRRQRWIIAAVVALLMTLSMLGVYSLLSMGRTALAPSREAMAEANEGKAEAGENEADPIYPHSIVRNPSKSIIVRNPSKSIDLRLDGVDFGHVGIAEVSVSGFPTSAMSAVHSARISSGEDLPPNTVEADRAATLAYQLKPPEAVGPDEQSTAPSASLLQAIRDGAYVDVVFTCNFCDDIDSARPAQRLEIDPTALSQGRLQSRPIVFGFTPRAPAETTPAHGGDPRVSLVFRYEGRDLDDWLIPVKVKAAAAPAAAEAATPAVYREGATGPPDRASSAPQVLRLGGHVLDAARASRPSPGQAPIRVSFSRPNNESGYLVTVSAPGTLRPWLRALEATGTHTEAKVALGNDFVSISYGLDYSEFSQLDGAAEAFQDALQSTILESAYRKSTCGLKEDSGHVDSAIIETCLRGPAGKLKNRVFPPAVQQVLFDLARCRQAAGGEDADPFVFGPPIIVFDRLPYMPLQMIPVDTVESKPGVCSKGLERTALAGKAKAVSEDYLGFLLPVMIETPLARKAISKEIRRLTLDAPKGGPRTLLAGIYGVEVDKTELSGLDLHFQETAKEIYEAKGVVARDSRRFRDALALYRGWLDLIVIHVHGERGRVTRPTEMQIRTAPPDRLLFAGYGGDPSAPLPPEATLTGNDMIDRIIEAGEPKYLMRRPTVLLLACDTSAFTGETSIPTSFIRMGAGAVIATDTVVDGRIARALATAFMAESRKGATAPLALFRARRSLLQDRDAALALLWHVVGPGGPR